jgi:hypothetical protein
VLVAALLLRLMLLVALLLALLLLLLLLLCFLLLHDEVADVAPLMKEGPHLDRLPELRCVLVIRGSSRRGPARKLHVVLLVNVLSHLYTTRADVAAY